MSQLEGDAVERINEDQVDDVIASAEKQESNPVWEILLVVASCAVRLFALTLAFVFGFGFWHGFAVERSG